MSVLKKYFDYKFNQCSPVQEDFERKVDYDEKGNEFISWVPVDNAKLVKSNGKAKDWDLTNLLKAGINPNFGIRTGLNTRLEGVGVINDAVAELDKILTETKTDE